MHRLCLTVARVDAVTSEDFESARSGAAGGEMGCARTRQTLGLRIDCRENWVLAHPRAVGQRVYASVGPC
jgi:hypothetical protein